MAESEEDHYQCIHGEIESVSARAPLIALRRGGSVMARSMRVSTPPSRPTFANPAIKTAAVRSLSLKHEPQKMIHHGLTGRYAMATFTTASKNQSDTIWKKAFDVSMTKLSKHFDAANTEEIDQAVVNMKDIATLVHRNCFLEVQVDVAASGDESDESKLLLQKARTQFVAAVKKGTKEGQILRVTLAMPKLEGRISQVMPLHSSAGQFIGEVPKLDCYILPHGGSGIDSKYLTWPLFGVSDKKQEETLGMSMLFDRCGRADIGRRESTLRALARGSDTAWVGLPGIGKSVASQSVLMGAIRKLGRGPNDIPMVFYRASDSLFLIYLDEEGKVEVKLRKGGVDLGALRTITDIATPFREKGFKKPVLILELDEKEEDPICPIPFHVSASSRQADRTLKTIFKMLAPFYLVQPWFEEELQMMYWLLDWSGSLSGKPHVHDWKNKFLLVGGVPRHVFNVRSADSRNKAISLQGLLEDAVKEVRHMRPYDLGRNVQNFVAPVIRPGVKVPLLQVNCFLSPSSDADFTTQETPGGDSDSGNQEEDADMDTLKFSFLSSKAARIMQMAVKSPAELEAFRRFGLEYQRLLSSGMLLARLPPLLQAKSSNCCHPCPTQADCIAFLLQVYVCPVRSLDGSRAYRSSVINGYLYDFMAVDHNLKIV
eukprot:gene26998-32618_t